MRKDGVKADWCKHSRNSSTGKRGHNKRVRRLPLPSQDEPVFTRGRKKRKHDEPYLIEFRLLGGKWGVIKRYHTREMRDAQLAKYLRGFIGYSRDGTAQYRARDEETP